MSHRLAAGLDFGTSNSAIGVHDGRAARLHRFGGMAEVIPSAVFYDLDEERFAFGQDAERRFLEGCHGRYLRALKSVLGTALAEDRTRLGRRSVRFVEILERFLGHMKAEAEAAAGAELRRVVCGRPVRFVDRHPERDRAAQDTLEGVLRRIGIEEVEFLPEPLAALIDAERLIDGPGLALVADIGGGTSDFAVVEVGAGRAAEGLGGRVLASAGVHVGGTDLDRDLSLRHAMPALGLGSETRPPLSDRPIRLPNSLFVDLATWQRIPLLYTGRTLADVEGYLRHAVEPEKVGRLRQVVEHELGHALAGAVEAAKTRLSAEEQAEIEVPRIAGFAPVPVTGAELEAAVAARTARISQTVAETPRLAGTTGAGIAFVVLTGGSTQLPAVRRAIAQHAPDARIVLPDRLGGIAGGLTAEAGRRFLAA